MLRERKARLETAAEQAAFAGLPPRPRSSPLAPLPETNPDTSSPDLVARPFTTPPTSEPDRWRIAEEPSKAPGSELSVGSGGLARSQVSGDRTSPSFGAWESAIEGSPYEGPTIKSVYLSKGLEAAPTPQTPGTVWSGTIPGLWNGLAMTDLQSRSKPLTREIKQGLGEPGLGSGLAATVVTPQSGRALPTAAVAEPKESLWEDQGPVVAAPLVGPIAEALPKELTPGKYGTGLLLRCCFSD